MSVEPKWPLYTCPEPPCAKGRFSSRRSWQFTTPHYSNIIKGAAPALPGGSDPAPATCMHNQVIQLPPKVKHLTLTNTCRTLNFIRTSGCLCLSALSSLSTGSSPSPGEPLPPSEDRIPPSGRSDVVSSLLARRRRRRR
jgi:hypothetical protein